MKIQKGQVKYNGRDDYYVTYGSTDDGKQYYFIGKDEDVLKNGNHIVTTNLVEAIDENVVPVNIGVINADGEEVISCTYRKIKPITDEILLAEVTTPTSQNVLDAISARNNPISENTLLPEIDAVREKIKSKTSENREFVFNNFFSEATIYDINGNNLVNGEYFSFIGLDNNKLYLSKNTIDSEVVEYSMLPPEIQANVSEEANNQIDVSQVEVSGNIVDNAMNNEISDSEKTPEVSDTNSEELPVDGESASDEMQVPTPEEMQAVDAIAPEVPMTNSEELPVEGESISDEVQEVKSLAPEIPVANSEDSTTEENDLEMPTISEDEDIAEDINPMEDIANELQVPQEITAEEVADVAAPESEEVEDKIEEEPTEDIDKTEETSSIDLDIPQDESINEEIEDEVEEDTINDLDKELELVQPEEDVNDTKLEDSMVQVDSIDVEDDYSDLIEDATDYDNDKEYKLMSGLIRQNTDLKDTVKELKEEIERKDRIIENLSEKEKAHEQKEEVLKEGRKKDKIKIANLEKENQKLKDDLSYEKKVNAAQEDEINILKPQVAGKEKVMELFSKAESVLDDYDMSDYDFSRKVA